MTLLKQNFQMRLPINLNWPVAKTRGILAERKTLTNLAALVIFLLLSLAVTWPLIRDFRSAIPSDGLDARHNVWILWHVKEALLGRQPLYNLDLLYFPEGVNLLTHSMGPVMALFSLPFHWLGPEAAYNGALLIGLALTGWFMYLLLVEIGFRPVIALWGGGLYLLAPIHLAGVYGHLDKVFLGLTPLALLCLIRITRNDRPFLWPAITALALFLTLQHNGYQFLMTAVLLGLAGLILLWRETPGRRTKFFKKLLLAAAFSAVLIIPQLLLINHHSQNPLYDLEASDQSTYFQPDLIEYFLPSGFHWYFGQKTLEIVNLHQQVETAVSLSLLALFFLFIGMWKKPRSAVPWALLFLVFFILSLGPSLKLFGERYLTLPYAFLVQLPGLEFLRTPGRFMMAGNIGLIIAAAFGLQKIIQNRSQNQAFLVLTFVFGLTLLEGFPKPWPQETLPEPPAFYETIAQDGEEYGVLDLPVRPTEFGWETAYSSFYQMLQMTHRKGIASGYISKVPMINPIFPCLYPTPVGEEPDFTVNGRPANCFNNLEERLAQYNYRYVVWHKPEHWPHWGYTADSMGYAEAQTIIQQTFGGRPPDHEDAAVWVYEVNSSAAVLPTEMSPRKNWYQFEGNLRWASSPAWIYISSPVEQEANLEIVFAMMFTPGGGYHVGSDGVLIVRMGHEIIFRQAVRAGEVVSIPLHLTPGTHLLKLELEAGNFQPTHYDSNTIDGRWLSFATESVNLRLAP